MKKISKKLRRQHVLKQIIKEKQISTQEELREELTKLGIEVTQSSLSRDLNELDIVKRRGFYVIPEDQKRHGALPPLTNMKWAGSNLLILKTYPSMAPAMGAFIDEQNINGVVGTVSGDDTVFVATSAAVKGEDIEREIRNLFG